MVCIAARRLLWITGVVPPLAIMTVSYYLIWGARIAGLHLLLSFSCRTAHVRTAPVRIQWRRLRQAYTPGARQAAGAMAALSPRLVMLTIHVPQGEAMLLSTPWGVPILAAFLAFPAVVVRLWAGRRRATGFLSLPPDELTLIQLN